MKKCTLILACLLVCLVGASPVFSAGYDKNVHQAQTHLKRMGYAPGTADGIMGNTTRMAVKQFQKKRGLPATGILNTETLNLILKVSAGPAGGSNAADQTLLAAQKLLSALGYSPGPADGVMGQNTRTAIKKFQRDKGLPVTGKLNDTTFQKMKKTSKDPRPSGKSYGNSGPSMDQGHGHDKTRSKQGDRNPGNQHQPTPGSD